MTLPVHGMRQPVTIVDLNGNQVGVVLGVPNRLAVDAVVNFDPTPGTNIQSNADVAVPIGATVALGAVPATARTMTVQNTGPSGTFIRVREVGAGAGRGILLPRFASVEYGGIDGSLEALEAQDVSAAVGGVAVATTVAVQFQED